MSGTFLLILVMIVFLGVIYTVSSKEHYFSIDPRDTGIERPLWGPLYRLPNRDNHYYTMHEIPMCVPPSNEGWKCARAQCSARAFPGAAIGVDCGPEIPYELDKI